MWELKPNSTTLTSDSTLPSALNLNIRNADITTKKGNVDKILFTYPSSLKKQNIKSSRIKGSVKAISLEKTVSINKMSEKK
jgi:hypothetical protein